MEKKTIGSFIAVLRKASGLTQRELAEKLNVSDKSVSRWERDECVPDLSLIPVIAEIFDITTDELLRGERKFVINAVPSSEEESSYLKEKSTKQFQNLLRTQQMKCKERSLIALGVTIGGYLAALICNFVFLKSLLGFYLSLPFYVTAVILEICFLRRAAVNEDDAFDLGKWIAYQNEIVTMGMKLFAAVGLFFAATFPLLPLGDSYYGLQFVSYFTFAIISLAAFSLLGFLVYSFAVKPSLIKKKLLFLTDEQKELAKKKRKLLKKTTITSGCIALICVILAAVAIESYSLFLPKKRFDTWEDFKAYMETPVRWENGNEVFVEPLPGTEYDEDEEYRLIEITGENGEIVCAYRWKNESAMELEYTIIGEGDDAYVDLPIYVIERWAYDAANSIASSVSTMFLAIAGLQMAAAAGIYALKSKKMK